MKKEWLCNSKFYEKSGIGLTFSFRCSKKNANVKRSDYFFTPPKGTKSQGEVISNQRLTKGFGLEQVKAFFVMNSDFSRLINQPTKVT